MRRSHWIDAVGAARAAGASRGGGRTPRLDLGMVGPGSRERGGHLPAGMGRPCDAGSRDTGGTNRFRGSVYRVQRDSDWWGNSVVNKNHVFVAKIKKLSLTY